MRIHSRLVVAAVLVCIDYRAALVLIAIDIIVMSVCYRYGVIRIRIHDTKSIVID